MYYILNYDSIYSLIILWLSCLQNRHKTQKRTFTERFFSLSGKTRETIPFVFNFNINILKFQAFVNKNYFFKLSESITIMDLLIFPVYTHLCCKNSATVLKTYFERIFSKLTSIPNWNKCAFLKRHCYSCVMYNFSSCKNNSIRYIARKIYFYKFVLSTEELL